MYRALAAGALALALLAAPGSAWAQQSDTSTAGISPSPSPQMTSPHQWCPRERDGAITGITASPDEALPPGAPVRVIVTGHPGTRGHFGGYTRPGPVGIQEMPFTLDEHGSFEFQHSSVGNARYTARHIYPDCPGATGVSVVVLRTTELGGVHAARLAPRQYRFNGIVGRGAPGGVDGKVLNLYRATRTRDGVIGAPVLTAQTRILGEFWSIERTFLGSGEFLFWIEAGDDINSLGGRSPQRFTVIH